MGKQENQCTKQDKNITNVRSVVFMKIYEIQERTHKMLDVFFNLWENSVRATHLFLSETEIKHIKQYVPLAYEDCLKLYGF